MMNYTAEIQRFNADKRISQLHSKYEVGAFLNCLSVSRREMSHSKFLAELFKEESFHGTGTLPLQLLMEAILDRAIKQDTRLIECPDKKVMFPSFKSAIMARNLSLSDIEVTTEECFSDKDGNSGGVDILVTCRVKPLMRENGEPVEFINIIIENKIYAQENDKQTEKYYKHFNAFLKNKDAGRVDTSVRKGGPRALYNLYVYLTPAAPSEMEGLKEPLSKCKECVQICYQDILDRVLIPLLEQESLSPRGRFFIEEYQRSLGVSYDNVEKYTPLLGSAFLNVNTIIMAISKKESDELCQLWNDYEDLFKAAINEKNRQDDDDCDGDNSSNTNKRVLYEYKGQPFTMGRLVEAVILDHLPEYSTDNMNQLFKDVVNCGIVTKKPKSSYFERIKEIQTKDVCSICVFKKWTERGQFQFSDFCNKVKELGWYEVKEYKEEQISPEDSLKLVEFYTKHEKLLTTAMEVIRREHKDGIGSDARALLKRTKSHRNRSTYCVTLHANNQTLRNLSWGRLVLTVLQDYASEESSTIDNLIKTFALPKNVLRIYEKDIPSGYFDKDVDMISLADDSRCLVKKGWKIKDLQTFIEAAKGVQYRIEEEIKEVAAISI